MVFDGSQTPDVAHIADRVCGLGMGTAAIFFLELHKPMCGLVRAGLTVAEPALAILLGSRPIEQTRSLFESADRVEELIAAIEARLKRERLSEDRPPEERI